MTRDIESMADVRLGPGTLYGALARLEERGLIEAAVTALATGLASVSTLRGLRAMRPAASRSPSA